MLGCVKELRSILNKMIYKRSEWAYNCCEPNIKSDVSLDKFANDDLREVVDECLNYFRTYENSAKLLDNDIDLEQFNKILDECPYD